MLYQLDMSDAPPREVIRGYWEGNDTDEDVRLFANELVEGVKSHLEEIDGLLAAHSTNWKISRMAAVDKNILRIAAYELVHRADIPVKVTINEAVEIAKRFGTAESGAFVNGILDNIGRGVGKACDDESAAEA
jgi:N utilization substance protein B